VIVTRGSGSDAFRTARSSWPVRGRRVERHGRSELEPDVDHLRSLLRRAYARGKPGPSEARAIAATAAGWTWQRSLARLDAVLQRHLGRARLTKVNRRARTSAVAYGFHSRGMVSWRKLCTEIDRSLATSFPNYRSFTRVERIDTEPVDIVLGQSEHCLELLLRARRQNPRCVVIVHQESTVLADRVAIVNRERRRCGVPPIVMSPLDLWRNRMENELADHFIVASSVARQCFIDHGTDPARVYVIPYGIARDTCHVRAGARTSRFLFAGTDPFRKGIRILFAAWEQAALRDAELVCLTDLEILRSKVLLGYLVRNPNITVRPLLGYHAFRRLYREIDCQVLPSLEDTFSRAVADGMAAGTPAIVSTATGVKDLIVHGVSGHIVPAGDVDALATALRAFGADRERRQAMGMAAHQAVQPHSWKRFRQRLTGLVQSIADERP
jgi:glycosyltransferase involved in cell wall biosynthesis